VTAWAGTQGKRAEMRRFVSIATRLAFTRQRMLKGRRVVGVRQEARRDESELLTELTQSRAALQAPATAFPGYAQHPGLPQAGWGQHRF